MPEFTVCFDPTYFEYTTPFEKYIAFVGEVLSECFGNCRRSKSGKGWVVRTSGTIRDIHDVMEREVLPAREVRHCYLIDKPYYVTDRDGRLWLPRE